MAHASGQSFGAEKSERISAAGARINARYPLYDRLVQAFIRQDPLIGPRLALALAAAPPDRPVPVYLGHIRGGGAELYLQERVAAARAAGGGRWPTPAGRGGVAGVLLGEVWIAVRAGAGAFIGAHKAGVRSYQRAVVVDDHRQGVTDVVRGDDLIGLKENIILGKLIPAGTGMQKYREFGIEAPDYEPISFYSSDGGDEEDPAAFLAGLHGTYSSDAAQVQSEPIG